MASRHRPVTFFDGEDTVRTVILKQIDGQRKLDDMRVAGQNRASL